MITDNEFGLVKCIADLGKTFSNEQRTLLLEIHDWMKAKGATREQLVLLGSLIFINWNYNLTVADIERATELAEKNTW